MKKRTIVDLLLILGLLVLLIFLGRKDYNVDKTKDNKRFDKDYSMVSKDNVFKYIDGEQVLNILDSDGIIFMAFKENEWSNYYANILNTSAKNIGIEEISYYDFLADRNKKSVDYQKIIKKMKNHLKKNDMDEVNLNAPCLVVVKNGTIFAYDDETSFNDATVLPKDYWNEERTQSKLQQFNIIFTAYMGGSIDGGEE